MSSWSSATQTSRQPLRLHNTAEKIRSHNSNNVVIRDKVKVIIDNIDIAIERALAARQTQIYFDPAPEFADITHIDAKKARTIIYARVVEAVEESGFRCRIRDPDGMRPRIFVTLTDEVDESDYDRCSEIINTHRM